MRVISVRNVCQALPAGLDYLLAEGRWEETRAGRALVAPGPVTTVYARPRERVLFSAARDANPFFHLAEALWMLAGRRDAAFLDRFVGNFGARFAELDGTIHGAYGHRWRTMLGYDQLDVVVEQLIRTPGSRQAVIQMWDGRENRCPAGECDGVDSQNDLTGGWLDRPCNTHAYLRIRNEIETVGASQAYGMGGAHQEPVPYLDVTVCCRSNDVVLGAYGANAVHFSVLQEYLAARLDVGVGIYYQVSNNFHAYGNEMDRISKRASAPPGHSSFFSELTDDRYSNADPSFVLQPLVHDVETFDEEVLQLLETYENWDVANERIADFLNVTDFRNDWLKETAWPVLMAHRHRNSSTWWRRWTEKIRSPDWREACVEWLDRRERARERKAGAT